MDWTHCNFLLQDYVYSEEHILKIKSLLHNPLEAHIILEETLVEIKWTAEDECLKSSVDSLYESIYFPFLLLQFGNS